MLSCTRITHTGHPLAGGWWKLYESAFPETERRALAQHASALKDASFHCLHLSDSQGFVGILSYWRWGKLNYVEHLAIASERRGQGLGHAALSMVSSPCILEIEPVIDAATARRLSFYESCGFTRLPHPHMQLAYQHGLPAVELWLLAKPVFTNQEVEEFESLYHAGPMRYRDEA